MRTLPLICIGNVAFYVDVMKEEFREYGNPDNCISFNQLQGAGDHYTLEFDKQIKNVKREGILYDPDHILIAHIPAIVKLDAAGLAHKFGKPVRIFMAMKDDTEW